MLLHSKVDLAVDEESANVLRLVGVGFDCAHLQQCRHEDYYAIVEVMVVKDALALIPYDKVQGLGEDGPENAHFFCLLALQLHLSVFRSDQAQPKHAL